MGEAKRRLLSELTLSRDGGHSRDGLPVNFVGASVLVRTPA